MSKVKAIGSADFDEFVKDGVCVVDFSATWCGPCKMMAPTFDLLSEQMPEVKFAKIDVDENSDVAQKYQVFSIPNICLFKNGTLIDRTVGLQSSDELKAFVIKHTG